MPKEVVVVVVVVVVVTLTPGRLNMVEHLLCYADPL